MDLTPRVNATPSGGRADQLDTHMCENT